MKPKIDVDKIRELLKNKTETIYSGQVLELDRDYRVMPMYVYNELLLLLPQACETCGGSGRVPDLAFGRFDKGRKKPCPACQAPAEEKAEVSTDWLCGFTTNDPCQAPAGEVEEHTSWLRDYAQVYKLESKRTESGLVYYNLLACVKRLEAAEKKGPKEMLVLQGEVGGWANKVFGKCQTVTGIINHLIKEVCELRDSNKPEEAADCLLLLFQHAHECGYDLLEEAKKKHEINLKRKWGKPDKHGVIEHIKPCQALQEKGE